MHPLSFRLWILWLSCVASFLSGALASDEKQVTAHSWLSGFENAVHGQPFPYPSLTPDLQDALLVRANKAFPYIAWDTMPVPDEGTKGSVREKSTEESVRGKSTEESVRGKSTEESVRGKSTEESVRFVWIFGIDANPEKHDFELHVNHRHCLTFSNPGTAKLAEWEVRTADGAKLLFKPVLIDRYDDLMGFAFLTLPESWVEKGSPVRIEVKGEQGDSPVWYMTFQRPVTEEINVESIPALLHHEDGPRQEIQINLLHLGEPSQVKIKIPDREMLTFPVSFGPNRYSILAPPVEKAETQNLWVQKQGEETTEVSYTLEPVRRWTLYLVQHSHTDIGYTRPQTEILPEHLRYIDYALDFCDATDGYPDDARFRWTCEASWPVREYLNCRPEAQIERLKKRVAEGRIALTAMMFNLSELTDEASFRAFLSPIRSFRQHGLDVTAATQNDVNGFAWCLADYLPEAGVSCFVMGQHSHRALTCFKRPTAFWWESPAGSRLLGFRADHYMTGNRWGLHTRNFELLKTSLFPYLEDLEEKGYPFDAVQVQYSGYLTDNAPPSLAGADQIKAWNERYAWPKLRSATIDEFMKYLREHHADSLAVYRAAWPDWWSDGYGSAARETAAGRRTHADLIATQGLLAAAAGLGQKALPHIEEELQEAYDALLFYDEHTFGASESISDPDCENSHVQWGEKSAYVWEAVKRTRLLREKALGFLHPHIPRADVPTLTLFNTLGWKRSGLHELYIDHQIFPPDKGFKVVDADGEALAMQRLSSRSDGSYWALWANDLPALSMVSYRIEADDEARQETRPHTGTVLENYYFKLEIDPATGTIRHLIDKRLHEDLVDANAEWGFLAFIYETLEYRQQLEQYKLDAFSRAVMDHVRIHDGVDGEIWKSLRISGASPGCVGDSGIQCEIRLYHDTPRIEFLFTIRKKEVQSPEGIYVAFPFKMAGSEIVYEAQGGLVSPGLNQMPGSSSDWHLVQNFAAVRKNSRQIILSCDQVPLMQFGDINLGRFAYTAKPEKPHIYSWVMNNYWTTNFCAAQRGEFKWSYFLTSTKDRTCSGATQFGWGCRVPIVSRVLPAGASCQPLRTISLLRESPPHNLLLVSAKPSADEKGVIFHWREVDGKAGEIDFESLFDATLFSSFREVNILEETIAEINGPVQIQPREVKFVQALFAKPVSKN